MNFFHRVLSGEPKLSKIYISAGSKILVVFFSILSFFMLAFPSFSYTAIRYIGEQKVTDVELFSGYQVLSVPYFKDYAFFFMFLFIAVTSIVIISFLLQIYSGEEANSINIVLLALQILCLEFMVSDMSLGGYLLLSLVIISYLQYFIFLGKRMRIDIWTFGATLLTLLAMIPSSIALGLLLA